MKKLIVLMLTVCMLAMLAPAMAESSSEGEGGLSALLGLLSSLSGGAEGEATEDSAEESATETEGIGSLLDMVNGSISNGGSGDSKVSDMMGVIGSVLGGVDSKEAKPVYTPVAAESIDQFYGTWVFSKAVMGGSELSVNLLALLGTTGDARLTIGDNSLDLEGKLGDMEKSYHVDSTEESKYRITMELVDGTMNLTLDGDVIPFMLTDDGQLVCEIEGLGTAFFTPAE